MLQWLTRKRTLEPAFRTDVSAFQGGPFGEIQRLSEHFESLRTKPSPTERDITETLDTCRQQLGWLTVLASRDKNFRNAQYSWSGIAALDKIYHICRDLQSPQLDDLMAVCEGMFRRAPWYPAPTRRRKWFVP